MSRDGTKALGFAALVSIRRLESLIGRDRRDIRRIAERAGHYYQPFDRRRDAADKWRHIDNPIGELKDLQRRIYRGILAAMPFEDHVVGGVKGKSIKDNMAPHIGQPVLVTLDLAHCFPSIGDLAVFDMFRGRLGYSEEVAALLTKLTTFQHRLPQGAPSSSVIANLVLEPLHRKIALIAEAYHLEWSIYVDDIALSGLWARDAMEPVIREIQRQGFRVAHRKIEVMASSEAQTLTGGVVNRKLSVGRKKIEGIRKAIIELHDRTGDISSGEIRSIRGKISQVNSINKTQGANLQRLAERLLPEPNVDGILPSSSETQRCTKFGRHRKRQTPKAPTNGGKRCDPTTPRTSGK